MISLSGLIATIIYLIVVGLIIWLLHWLIGYCGIPEPFNKVARVVLAVVSVIICSLLLLSLVSGKPVFSP